MQHHELIVYGHVIACTCQLRLAARLVHLNAHHVRLEVADMVYLPLEVLDPAIKRNLLLGLRASAMQFLRI